MFDNPDLNLALLFVGIFVAFVGYKVWEAKKKGPSTGGSKGGVDPNKPPTRTK